MKSVIIIGGPPLFQKFLKDKLAAEKVTVTVAKSHNDGFIKLRSNLPDLIIIDTGDDFQAFYQFLEDKFKNPNMTQIPVIAAGAAVDRTKIQLVMKFGVVKYFTKPIKFDLLFEAVGRILRLSLSMDVTPCVLDLHRNGDIIFIEIAQALNREKIALLKYKLAEIIEKEKLQSPKIVLMLSNLELTFLDTPNLELLLDSILDHHTVKPRNVKILSFDNFTKELVAGHSQYAGIDVVENISEVLTALAGNTATVNTSDFIADKILTPMHDDDGTSIETRFHSDGGVIQDVDDDTMTDLRIALVDDDAVTLTLLENAFKAVRATCDLYSSGAEFMAGVKRYHYDLIVLDIFMPGISGFDILRRLQTEQNVAPVIIYSQATQREAVMQALNMGAKQYIVKPQKPESLVQRALELLHG
ncbi:MAG: response regulator [Treponema sp.]|nr:response regulator [Treponema sp.]